MYTYIYIYVYTYKYIYTGWLTRVPKGDRASRRAGAPRPPDPVHVRLDVARHVEIEDVAHLEREL